MMIEHPAHTGAYRRAHVRDASILVLTWHLGAAAVLAALGAWLGRRIVGWRPNRSPLA